MSGIIVCTRGQIYSVSPPSFCEEPPVSLKDSEEPNLPKIPFCEAVREVVGHKPQSARLDKSLVH